MKLKDLLNDINILEVNGDMNTDITGIAYDSRKVEKGNLFICISGFSVDGHKFSEEAVKKGASAILVEKPIENKDAVIIRVENTRELMPKLAARYFGNPTDSLSLIGITGTNGKTTTTYLIKSILEKSGKTVGLLGTIAVKIGEKTIESSRTTPESLDLQMLFREMADTGVTHAVMEVSSHSLELGRVEGCNFHTGIFTNLTQDHLDFHDTIENYRAAKEKLFYKTKGANIINIDDEHGRIIAEHIKQLKVPMYTYAIDREADFMAKNIEISAVGVTFTLITPEYEMDLKINIPGKFSVYNALAAAAAAYMQSISREAIKAGLEEIRSVPGRSEVVNIDKPYTVIVDYAHTPDGMSNILTSVRQYVKGKIITVFGCGGDRDKTKRPIMGEIGGKLSDYCIITSDNPRSEDPMDIINQVEEGIKTTDCKYECIESRKDAIKRALEIAQKDDIVLIIGKGHETYQILKDKTIPFDDREIVKEIVRGGKMEWLNISEVIEACNGTPYNHKDNIVIKGVTTDSRKVNSDDLFIAIKGENFDGHDFIHKAIEAGAALVLTEKAIDKEVFPYILVENTIEAMHKLAKYYKSKFKIPYVALTGSSGKTTTKEMVWSVLSQKYNTLKNEGNYNNAIGLPLTIFNLSKQHEVAVLEMGMNSLGEIEALADIVHPDVAIITNVGTAHIEKLGTRENILKAKLEIFTFFDEKNVAIINGDNDLLKTVQSDKFKIIKYGLDKNNHYTAFNITENKDMGIEFDVVIDGKDEHFIVPLPGIHNVYNALSAIAVGIHLGVELDEIRKGLIEFKPAKMRMNIFTNSGEIKVIDDAYNANPDSMKAAIDVLKGLGEGKRKVAVLGNMLELGQDSVRLHYDVGAYAAKKGIDILIAVGDLAKHASSGAVETGMNRNKVYCFDSNDEAIREIANILEAGDVVLIKGSRASKMEQIVDYLREGIK